MGIAFLNLQTKLIFMLSLVNLPMKRDHQREFSLHSFLLQAFHRKLEREFVYFTAFKILQLLIIPLFLFLTSDLHI